MRTISPISDATALEEIYQTNTKNSQLTLFSRFLLCWHLLTYLNCCSLKLVEDPTGSKEVFSSTSGPFVSSEVLSLSCFFTLDLSFNSSAVSASSSNFFPLFAPCICSFPFPPLCSDISFAYREESILRLEHVNYSRARSRAFSSIFVEFRWQRLRRSGSIILYYAENTNAKRIDTAILKAGSMNLANELE